MLQIWLKWELLSYCNRNVVNFHLTTVTMVVVKYFPVQDRGWLCSSIALIRKMKGSAALAHSSQSVSNFSLKLIIIIILLTNPIYRLRVDY